MRNKLNGLPALVIVFVAAVSALPALAQTQQKDKAKAFYGNCGAPNAGGPNSTSYYSKGDSCAYVYSVPAERLPDLLNTNTSCVMYSRTQVNCSQPIKGNYGQIELDRRDGAGAGGGQTPGTAAELSFPATPPLGVPSAQRGTADQMWQRAAGLIDKQNYTDAMPLLLLDARLGDARAQTMLGIVYQEGDGLKANDRAAAYWFGVAATQGNRVAQYALAGMYEAGGGGLPKNPPKATELYIKSANQGFDKAQVALGIAYELGEGVAQNRSQALTWLTRADPQGSGFAGHLAVILRAPGTPRFANATALASYLNKLRIEEQAKMTVGGAPAFSPNNPISVARINAEREYSAWLAVRRVGNGGNCGSKCVF